MSREVEVRFFGSLSRLVGSRTRRVVLAEGVSRVADLRVAIADQVPEIAAQLHHTAIGAGTEILDEDALVPEDAEVALLPPVSGG